MHTLEILGKKLGQKQEEQPWLFLSIATLITVLTLPGLFLLLGNVEPSIEKVLPQDVAVVQTMNAMRSQYGADMLYLVIQADETAATISDIRHPSVLDYEHILSQKLRQREDILEVQSVADLVIQSNGAIPDNFDVAKRIIEEQPQSSLFVDEQARISIIQIRTDTGADTEQISLVVNAIHDDIDSLAPYNPGVSTKLTGFTAIDKATFDIIISDFARITGVSFTLMVLFLLLYFRKPRKVLIGLSVIMLALIWTLGITGYLGITITVVTMVAAAMIMALGIDYGVHLVHRYEELRKLHDKRKALLYTQEELLRAFIGSSLTTSAGFLALLAGTLPAMKNLGIILGIGIMITMAISVFVTPVILYLTDRNPTQKNQNR
jgi:hydrophobe/amphiphile efflux-3 (HAE3) family protein